MKDSSYKKWILPAGNFRSRTEQFFAGFLEHHKIPYTYEAEGFIIPEPRDEPTCYCPDFWLPESNVLVEVKPVVFFGETWKIQRLMTFLHARGETAEAWIVDVQKYIPVPLARFRNGEWSWPWQIGNGEWKICDHCGKPFPLHFNYYDCSHCGASHS